MFSKGKVTLDNPLLINGFNFREVLVLVLFFALPFFHKYSNLTIALILLLSLLEIIRKKKLPIIELFWFLPVLFLYYTISELASGGGWSSIEKRLLFFLIPLVFALNSNFRKENLRNKIYLSYILGNLSAIVICFGRAIARSFILENGHWTFNPKVIQNTEYDFLTSSVMGGNYFFGEDFSFFHHPTYAGMFIVFAQYLIFELFKAPSSRRSKQLLIGCYVIFLIALFLMSSKAAIISSLLVSCWILFAVRIPQAIKTAIFTGFAIVCALFLFFNPRLKVFKETLKITQFVSPDPNARFGHDLRILSWDASLDLIKDNWLLGVGEANKRSALVDVYNQKGYIVPAEKMHNSHNQYLDFLIGGGLIGFGLFMTGLIELFVRSVRENNFPLLAAISIFSFIAMFENLLSRHDGILFFSIFVTLLAMKIEATDLKQIKPRSFSIWV